MTHVEACKLLDYRSGDDLKAAYRRAVMRHHPDRGGSQEHYEKVVSAYLYLRTGVTTAIVTPKWTGFHSEMFQSTDKPKKRVPMTESKFSKDVQEIVEGLGGWTFKKWGNLMEKVGIPDRYVAHPKWTGWLEEKVNDHFVEPHQQKVHEAMHKRGVACLVIRFREGRSMAESRLAFEFNDGVQDIELAVLPIEVWQAPQTPERSKEFYNALNVATSVLAKLLQKRIGDWTPNGRVQ